MRIVPRLDIKGPNLIKGIQFEGLRVIGIPNEFALNYYRQGADELIFIDTVASLYGRNQLESVLREAAENIFIPMAVGGGINSVDNAKSLLRMGADKIAVNTAAIARPQLISEIANEIGSQSVIISIEAKRQSDGTWEAYTENGRQRSGVEVVRWAETAEKLGAGEILLTSVDRDGTEKGFDFELYKCVRDATSLPIILSGGFGSSEHLVEVAQCDSLDAIAFASAIHYERTSISRIRNELRNLDVEVREFND